MKIIWNAIARLGGNCRAFLLVLFTTVAVMITAGFTTKVVAQTQPYPSSTAITGFKLDWSTYKRHADGSDIWPTTWASDGVVYTPFFDGGGFGIDSERRAYVGIGIARIRGNRAASVVGDNLISGVDWSIAPCFPLLPNEQLWIDKRDPQPGHTMPCRLKSINAKSVSALALNGVLYTWLMPGSGPRNLQEHRLYRGTVATNSWTRASWGFKPSDASPITSPVFLQAGQNAAAIRDYVYAYAARHAPVPDPTQKYQPIWLHKSARGGEIVLLRARKNSDLLLRSSWQFYAGLDGSGVSTWTNSLSSAKPVFNDPNGVGLANNAIYLPNLGRVLLFTHHTADAGGHFGLFEAPNVWGPWRTIFYGVIANEGRGVPAKGFTVNFLANSFSADGKRFTLVLSGLGILDSLSLIDGSFATVGAGAS